MQLVFSLFLILFAGGFSCITALRCYTCEDCDEYAKLSDLEIEICSPPPINGIAPSPSPSPSPSSSPSSSPSPSPSPGSNTNSSSSLSPSPSPAAPAPAPAPAPPANSDESEEEEDEDYDSNDSATVGIMPGNGGNGNASASGPAANPPGNRPAAAPAPAPINSAPEEEDTEEEEEEEDEDYDARRKGIAPRQQIMETPNAVCYVVRLQLNGTVITNRGCTMAMASNVSAACENLYDPWNMLGCDICEQNTCNGPITLSSSDSLQSSSSKCMEWTMIASLLSIVLTFSNSV